MLLSNTALPTLSGNTGHTGVYNDRHAGRVLRAEPIPRRPLSARPVSRLASRGMDTSASRPGTAATLQPGAGSTYRTRDLLSSHAQRVAASQRPEAATARDAVAWQLERRRELEEEEQAEVAAAQAAADPDARPATAAGFMYYVPETAAEADMYSRYMERRQRDVLQARNAAEVQAAVADWQRRWTKLGQESERRFDARQRMLSTDSTAGMQFSAGVAGHLQRPAPPPARLWPPQPLQLDELDEQPDVLAQPDGAPSPVRSALDLADSMGFGAMPGDLGSTGLSRATTRKQTPAFRQRPALAAPVAPPTARSSAASSRDADAGGASPKARLTVPLAVPAGTLPQRTARQEHAVRSGTAHAEAERGVSAADLRRIVEVATAQGLNVTTSALERSLVLQQLRPKTVDASTGTAKAMGGAATFYEAILPPTTAGKGGSRSSARPGTSASRRPATAGAASTAGGRGAAGTTKKRKKKKKELLPPVGLLSMDTEGPSMHTQAGLFLKKNALTSQKKELDALAKQAAGKGKTKGKRGASRSGSRASSRPRSRR